MWMDEILYTNILKSIGIIAGVLGIVIGLDLLSGARISTGLKRTLDKSFDLDTFLRRALDKTFNFDDKVITKPKAKRNLGILFLVLALVILLLIIRV